LRALARNAMDMKGLDRPFCVAAVTLIGIYLIASATGSFQTFGESWAFRHPLVSDTIDLANEGMISWRVPKDEWALKDGKAELQLTVDVRHLGEIPRSLKDTDLRARISAYGNAATGRSVSRFMKYDAIGKSVSMGKMEFAIGEVAVHSDE